MTSDQAELCLLAGARIAVELAESGADLIGAGDMGIGNTTASSAIAAVITGRPPEETTGNGTGRTPEQLRHKGEVVREGEGDGGWVLLV